MGKTVMRTCEVELTEREKHTRGIDLAMAQGELEVLTMEFGDIRQQFNEKRKRLEKRIGDLAKAVRTGKEEREVECIERNDYYRQVVQLMRSDTGECISEREMTLEERQERMRFSGDDAVDLPPNIRELVTHHSAPRSEGGEQVTGEDEAAATSAQGELVTEDGEVIPVGGGEVKTTSAAVRALRRKRKDTEGREEESS